MRSITEHDRYLYIRHVASMDEDSDWETVLLYLMFSDCVSRACVTILVQIRVDYSDIRMHVKQKIDIR